MAKSPNLNEITDFELLLQYLEDNLGWPLDGYKYDDVTFTYEPEELGLKEQDAVRVRSIRQLRPLADGQPWGIFFVEFEKKKLPVVLLRRILSHLVLKKRASANSADRARWHAHDILFISQFGGDSDREMAFAHFKDAQGDLPTLNVLGWDGGDTQLKLSHLRQELETNLHWPDDTRNADAWRAAWAKPFKHGVRHTIRTADALAEAMAELARRIRDAASALMKVESEKGPLRRMHTAFKTALIHDLTEEGFADTYAQTITYGLLTAAISRTDMQGGKHGTALVADNVADMVPITNPFLKEMLQSFLKVGGRKGGIDFDELGIQDVVQLFRSEETDLPAVIRDFDNKSRGEDPVIHFYEHFLTKYNKKLKIQRGVFYTPKPVVSYIVRSVDELLRTEFGITDGLASTVTWREMRARNAELRIPESTAPDSPFVMVLDPATGTATFLVEVIDLVHKRLKENWAKGGLKAMPKLPAIDFPRPLETFHDYWNSYVPLSLLRRLHGYELMMAPYAIAHMKIGLKLAETGYRFGTEERARIYLTNALESVSESSQLTIADWVPALAHEADAVNEIKQRQRFTVVIGNPPYSKVSQNMGAWIRAKVEDYMQLETGRMEEKGNRNALQDDYIKFIRLAFDVTSVPRVIAFITNNSYWTGLWFRAMRYQLQRTGARIALVDLSGGSRQGTIEDGDENVFDIQVGVGITLLHEVGHGTGDVTYASMVGSRSEKFHLLSANTQSSLQFVPLDPNAQNAWFFAPISVQSPEWETWVPLTQLFREWGAGALTNRDGLAVDFEDSALLAKIDRFCDLSISDAQIEEEFGFSSNYQWSTARARKRLSSTTRVDYCEPYLYRVFDLRRVYWTNTVVYNMRGAKMDVFRGQNRELGLMFGRRTSKTQYSHVFITRNITDRNCFEYCNIAPLFIHELASAAPLLQATNTRVANIVLGNVVGVNREWSEEDLLHYIYAVLHSATYRLRYADALRIEPPRIPPVLELELSDILREQGKYLIGLHLLESPILVKPLAVFIGTNRDVGKVGWTNDSGGTVWIDAAGKKSDAIAGTTGFRGVTEEVWNFQIGGYQVCEKWLKDRKHRTLSTEDIAQYQKIVVALSETIRIQKEIDRVIEQHGGWPGAFATNAPLATEVSESVAPPKAKTPKATKDLEPEDGPGYIPDPGEIPFV